MKMPGISPSELNIIIDIFKRFCDSNKFSVFAFGSRTLPGYRKNSDLDLLLMAENNPSAQIVCEIRDEFEQSDLPFRVDLLIADELSSAILANIRNQKLIKII